jgi:predicted nucleotidyltransferase
MQVDVLKLLGDKLPILRGRFGVKRIGVFGSVARGRITEDSDVDLFIEFDRVLGFEFLDLVEFLEDLLEREVDVLTPAGLKSIRIPSIARSIQESIIYV